MEAAAHFGAATVATTTDHLIDSPLAGEELAEAARKAQDWAGEAFLHADEEVGEVLAPGTARRRALDDALAEIGDGLRSPSYGWKVKYGLMLGLERVLVETRPKLASGKTELRRHQIDALAGMLTELLHANQRERETENGNGNGHAAVVEVADGLEEEPEDELGLLEREPDEDTEEDAYAGPDPGAARRFRFRHPTASGKTIAAAGFVEAARTLGVLILTHRRLLVQQFNRDLTEEGYGDRFTDAIMRD